MGWGFFGTAVWFTLGLPLGLLIGRCIRRSNDGHGCVRRVLHQAPAALRAAGRPPGPGTRRPGGTRPASRTRTRTRASGAAWLHRQGCPFAGRS